MRYLMNLRMYGFIDNNNVSKENIIEKYNKLLNQMDFKKNMKYYNRNTSEKEIEIFIEILKEK